MDVTYGPVVLVDMSKAHHLLVVESRNHDVLHVSCVDCDDARDYPFAELIAFTHWVEAQEDVQVLSWISVDGRF